MFVVDYDRDGATVSWLEVDKYHVGLVKVVYFTSDLVELFESACFTKPR